MDRGYVKLWRKTLDSPVFANPELLKLWVLCLLKASHKEQWVHIDGVTQPIHLQPGQFVTGRYALHKEYYPRKRKSNKSPWTLWKWMQILENLGNLSIKTSNKYSIITIINWDIYQANENQNEQQNEQQASNRRAHTRMNKKKDLAQWEKTFEIFWEHYPRKVGKKKAWERWLKLKDPEEILEKIRIILPKQKKSDQWQDERFIPHPATYLNQERYNDEIKAPKDPFFDGLEYY